MSNLLSSFTAAQLRRAAEIKDTISRLERELFFILGSSTAARKTKPKMSAAARNKIAAAQKARWAKIKKAKPAAKAPAKKRKMSAAARAKISAAAKARWAKVKATGKKSL
jgi:hypothetical protein